MHSLKPMSQRPDNSFVRILGTRTRTACSTP